MEMQPVEMQPVGMQPMNGQFMGAQALEAQLNYLQAQIDLKRRAYAQVVQDGHMRAQPMTEQHMGGQSMGEYPLQAQLMEGQPMGEPPTGRPLPTGNNDLFMGHSAGRSHSMGGPPGEWLSGSFPYELYTG